MELGKLAIHCCIYLLTCTGEEVFHVINNIVWMKILPLQVFTCRSAAHHSPRHLQSILEGCNAKTVAHTEKGSAGLDICI